MPGGKCHHGESLLDAIKRECLEEIGTWPEIIKLIPIERFTSTDQRFSYNTFFCSIAKEFIPTLNNEHVGYAWIDSNSFPRPLHPGLWSTMNFDEVKQKIEIVKNNFRYHNN